MRSPSNWKDWFILSKRDRKVAVGLAIFIVSFSSWLIFYNPKQEPPVIENLDDALATLSSPSGDSTGFQPSFSTKDSTAFPVTTAPAKLFYFDPNTLDEPGFTNLGISEKTIKTIINYRNKGGHFYKPEDIRKIYGLTNEEADKLIPFVKINSANQNQNSFPGNSSDKSFYTKEKPQIIDINKATVEQWKALPAIGDALSNRIVKYRDKMGGFTSIEQVKQTYGLSDSAYQIILPYLRFSSNKTITANTSSSPQKNTSASPKININKATAEQLKSIAAIPPDVADAIIIYRKQHGNYTSVEGIKKIIFINEEIYEKIAPYLIAE